MQEVINISKQDKAQKWDKVVEYLEITGVFVDCDEEIVMDVLKKGTENHEKIQRIKEHVSFNIQNLGKPELLVIINGVREVLGLTALSKGERIK